MRHRAVSIAAVVCVWSSTAAVPIAVAADVQAPVGGQVRWCLSSAAAQEFAVAGGAAAFTKAFGSVTVPVGSPLATIAGRVDASSMQD